MAKSYDNNPSGQTGPKKANPVKPPVPASARLSDAQHRAQQMASKPPANPTQFFQEAWVELKKTSWPNRDVLTKSTTVVLALVVAVAIWVGGIDAVMTKVSLTLFSSGR